MRMAMELFGLQIISTTLFAYTMGVSRSPVFLDYCSNVEAEGVEGAVWLLSNLSKLLVTLTQIYLTQSYSILLEACFLLNSDPLREVYCEVAVM